MRLIREEINDAQYIVEETGEGKKKLFNQRYFPTRRNQKS